MFSTPHPIIGMIHLQPLPGSPRYGGNLGAIHDAALADAQALRDGGAHGLMLENFGDVPFYPARVPAHVVAHMSAIAAEIRRRVDLPLGTMSCETMDAAPWPSRRLRALSLFA